MSETKELTALRERIAELEAQVISLAEATADSLHQASKSHEVMHSHIVALEAATSTVPAAHPGLNGPWYFHG